MKKYLALFLVVILMAASLSACGKQVEAKGANAKQNGSDQKLEIVTTIFPEYDWVCNLVGGSDRANLTMLLDNGVDLHSYQPTVSDIMKISTCDLFVYVGGESDEWVEDALKQVTNQNMKVINLLEALGDAVKAEEIVEGMEHDHDHKDGDDHDHEDGDDHDHEDGDDHDHEDSDDHEDGDDHDHGDGDDHDHDHDHEEEMDEHVWLSLRNTSVICNVITDALCELDPKNKETYQANLESYQTKLSALDQEYVAATQKATYKTLLFGDRFPFRYLVDDYGLSYYAAFAGCSAESEASFETVTFLAGKLDELKLPAIMTIEGKNHKIAETIRTASKAKNQEILTMDSMQATTMQDVKNGTTYLKIMTGNLEVLKKAIQ
ncbi:MAG: zinc ABC transporter substrate-binding protein [Lachnospiraceae bacterium]|nr:zinc ABC transporter substrate-binding protein [Lachnospiraceae bacterium]MBR3510291.1 zinc ABC transporter substrate-binding protein [Lachnospiraceae bacterium]MBR4605284.1 zinc ABC transporter substrate-binding protein [Lachnospiraceae bacterium]